MSAKPENNPPLNMNRSAQVSPSNHRLIKYALELIPLIILTFIMAAQLYASVKTENNSLIKCAAVSFGGNINVTCNTPSPETLTVLDYQYSGWYAWVDGKSQPLLMGDWLSVYAPLANILMPFDTALGIYTSALL